MFRFALCFPFQRMAFFATSPHTPPALPTGFRLFSVFSLSSVGNRNSSVLFVCITVCGFLFVLFVFIVVHSSTIAETGLFSFIIFKILFVFFSFFNMTSNAFLRVELWREEYTQHTNTLVCLSFVE